MDVALNLSENLLRALGRLLLNPFYYVGVLFVVLQYRRQIALERKLFFARLHFLGKETLLTVLWGAVAGIALSLLMLLIGAKVSVEAVIAVWVVSLLLMLLRVRYLCMAYATGVIGLAQAALDAFWPAGAGRAGWAAPLADSFDRIDVPSLLLLSAALHGAEALLVRFQGRRMETPLFVESKRGRIVGAYHLQGFWPVPLLLLSPDAGAGFSLPWDPIFAGGWHSYGIAAFPALVGFTHLTLTRLPRDKVRRSFGLLLAYALVMAVAAAVSLLGSVWISVAAVLSILLHEALIAYGNWEETKRNPLYAHDERGLNILAVLPGSPAEAMGLQAGEIVHKVNGLRVRDKEELHQAMRSNAAFCKLEVLNLDGQSKFTNRAVYDEDHHQLGILLAPDDQAPYFVKDRQAGILSYIRKRWIRLAANPKQTPTNTTELS